MKRKTFCRCLFATALLVSATSLSHVIWANEMNAPDNTQTQTTLDTQPTVNGTADLGDGQTIAATASVKVIAGTQVQITGL